MLSTTYSAPSSRVTRDDGAEYRGSGASEDAVQVRPADRARGLGHLRSLVVDHDIPLSLPLLFALHAVELAAVCLTVGHDNLLIEWHRSGSSRTWPHNGTLTRTSVLRSGRRAGMAVRRR